MIFKFRKPKNTSKIGISLNLYYYEGLNSREQWLYRMILFYIINSGRIARKEIYELSRARCVFLEMEFLNIIRVICAAENDGCISDFEKNNVYCISEKGKIISFKFLSEVL